MKYNLQTLIITNDKGKGSIDYNDWSNIVKFNKIYRQKFYKFRR